MIRGGEGRRVRGGVGETLLEKYRQINIKLIETILKQHINAMNVERLLNYIGPSKKDPINRLTKKAGMMNL